MIISFAWTTEALLNGTKTVTRRAWQDHYAERFRDGDIVEAWDKSPRFGGKRVAFIQLTVAPYKQLLASMPDDHFEREGGRTYWASKADFIEMMGGPDAIFWVIEFRLLEAHKGAGESDGD